MSTADLLPASRDRGSEINRIMFTLLARCQQRYSFDSFYVALYDEGSHTIEHPLFLDRGEFLRVAPRDIRTTPGLSGEVIKHGQLIYLPDTLQPEVAARYPIVRAGGTPSRTYLGVPLGGGKQVLGVLSLQSYQIDAFSAAQIEEIRQLGQAAGHELAACLSCSRPAGQ